MKSKLLFVAIQKSTEFFHPNWYDYKKKQSTLLKRVNRSCVQKSKKSDMLILL